MTDPQGSATAGTPADSADYVLEQEVSQAIAYALVHLCGSEVTVQEFRAACDHAAQRVLGIGWLEQVGALIPESDGGSRFVWKVFSSDTGAQPVYRLALSGANDRGNEPGDKS